MASCMRVDRRDRAGRGAEADQQAAALQRVQRGAKVSLPTLSKTTGDAGAVGELADPRRRRPRGVVDDRASQPWARAISAFSSRGDGADDGEAEQLRPLDDDQADAAGRGVQQDGVARLQPGSDPAQQVGGGQAAHGHRRGGLEGDGVRQLDQRAGRHHALGADRRPAGCRCR